MIGQRLFTGRVAVAQAALEFRKRIFEMTKQYTGMSVTQHYISLTYEYILLYVTVVCIIFLQIYYILNIVQLRMIPLVFMIVG